MRDKVVEELVHKASAIYTLIKCDERDESDALIMLFKDLMKIILSGIEEELEDYASKAFQLNIYVDEQDVLGSRIKAFINIYLNEIEIEPKL